MTIVADSMHLPFVSSTPSIARTKLAAFLTVNRVEIETIDIALIVLSEMIANAVCHGTPDSKGMMEIGWSLNGVKLELEVADSGDSGDLVPKPFDEDSTNGRGLAIISQLSQDWSVDQSAGTRIRATLPLS